MKNLIPNSLLIVFSILILQSCNKYDANGKLIKEYEELNKANWLLGEWQKEDSLGLLVEIWKSQNDSTFTGQSYYILNKKDTVHSETIELKQNGDNLIYSPTVKGQNNNGPVSFLMIEEKDSVMVFENPKHDYPQKIRYQLNSDKSLIATISGIQKGKESSESYLMQKKN